MHSQVPLRNFHASSSSFHVKNGQELTEDSFNHLVGETLEGLFAEFELLLEQHDIPDSDLELSEVRLTAAFTLTAAQ